MNPSPRRCLSGCLLVCLFIAGPVTAEQAKPNFVHQTLDKIAIGYGVAVGDVDGDGKPDILLADKKQFVWYQNPGFEKGADPSKATWKKHVMVENLTQRDNVCIAARDIDGDGKVEVAVGAQWNPGNTVDPKQSGSVHYLIRPKDPTKKWKPVKLHHEPTIHRMRWVRVKAAKDIDPSDYRLVVLPLHGVGNKGGKGKGVRVLAYELPAPEKVEDGQAWKTQVVDDSMHMTHNLEVMRSPDGTEGILVAGAEGFTGAMFGRGIWEARRAPFNQQSEGAGEVRFGQLGARHFIAAIEPMHGHQLVVYSEKAQGSDATTREVLDASLKHGHALAIADVLGINRHQIVVGWRFPNAKAKVGVKLFVPGNDGKAWVEHLIDDNQMACEDLRVADLNGDGKPDIIAAGRATRNLKVYWNQTN